ncbi:MAG: ABC transporter permease subunit [Anaerolineae bacterium]|nr:ABC transporter permease subunit [Anaerolineae bacterium]
MPDALTLSRRAEALAKGPTLAKRVQNALGRDWNVAYLLMAPTVILMGGLIAYPFLRAFYISFTNTTTRDIGPFIGLTNYINLWKDIFFRRSVVITAKFTLSAVFLKFLVGLLAAILLNRLGGRASFWTGLVLLPWIMPDIVRAITWKSLLDPLYGGLNRGLVDLGIISKPLPFLTGIKTALPTVIVVNLWQGIPFFTINMLAGLKAIDQELYEAAAIDGASPWRQFLHITLPGLRYVIIVVTLLSTIWTFNSFGLIFLLTGGGPMDATKVYSILAYNYAIGGLRYGPGIAVSMTMAPVLAIFIVILGRYMMSGRRLYEEQTETGPGPIMQVLSWIVWPLRMVIRLLLAFFWILNDGIELLLEAIGRFVARARRAGEHRVRRRRVNWGGAVLPMVALVLLLIFELVPFYWVIVTAFKTELQITMFEKVAWPAPWSIEQFVRLFGPARNFVVWLRNTVTISCITPLLSTMIASASAYALTRLQWRGAAAFSRSVLVAYLMPGIMMLIPIYNLFSRLRLTNSLMALILSYPTFSLPFAIWLMMGYYSSIPEELEAAALIDGCNRLQTFYKVVLPLTKPALLAVALFGVTQAWSEFLFAYVMIQSESKMTVPVGLAQMIITDVLPWGELCAAALIMAVPVLILYSLGQRFMVAGLTAGAVKGGG